MLRFRPAVIRLALVASVALVAPVRAETDAAAPAAEVSVATLAQTMRFGDLFAVLRDEGVAYGDTLETDMFPAGGGPGWDRAVATVYDAPKLAAAFETAIATQLGNDPEALAEINAFFSSDLGQRIVALEIDARRAFLDTAAEEAARVAADRRAARRDPKVALIGRFIEAGDLLEMNVAGALSGNLAFMKGMSGTGAYGAPLPEDQLMSDIWAQEDQIRDDTNTWLYAYLGLAYDPLTEAELEAYVAFSERPAGRRLNAALFTAFDAVFQEVSHDLGRAAGIAMQGSDI
jgi:hypothetical protein